MPLYRDWLCDHRQVYITIPLEGEHDATHDIRPKAENEGVNLMKNLTMYRLPDLWPGFSTLPSALNTKVLHAAILDESNINKNYRLKDPRYFSLPTFQHTSHTICNVSKSDSLVFGELGNQKALFHLSSLKWKLFHVINIHEKTFRNICLMACG